VRAKVQHTRGPRLYRWASFIPALALLAMSAGLDSGRLFSLAIALFALTPLLFNALMGLAPKQGEIELGAGKIKIHRRGMPSETIVGKALRGASTAQFGEGVALSLDTRGQPITLELESETDADAVRQSLGAGHDGFGQVQWFTGPGVTRLTGLSLVAAGAASFAFAQELPPVSGLATLLLVVGTVSFMTAPFLLLLSWALRPPRLVLRPEGVAIFRQNARDSAMPSTFHPWNEINHAEERQGELVIVLRRGGEVRIPRRKWVVDWRGMTRRQRTQIVAQINSGARRAEGRGKPRPTVAEELEQLAESTADTRTWLARIEAAAERMRADVGYYRGSSLAREDLWSALENHDAPARLRATAARLLARVETDQVSKERIERAVGSVREQETQHRIRIAIGDDLEQTAQEMEAIEAAEAERQRRAMKAPYYGS